MRGDAWRRRGGDPGAAGQGASPARAERLGNPLGTGLRGRLPADRHSPRPPRASRGRISMMRTLFLHPPSFEGFDGGAGARYQAKREIRSYWYPTWLAQPAALVPDSKLVDAP